MGDVDSIASCTRSCVTLFQQLRDLSQSPILEVEDQLPLQTLNVQDSRFSLWARNIAALHPAYLPSSLEHRIRDDESALKIVKSALRYVEESLEMALSILSGDKPNETWDVESESTGKTFPTQQTSELTELSLAIDDGIANLFQLSMIIRKKPETDEYLKAASKFPMPSDIDIIRVGDKFPVTNGGPSWLKERLGQAITRRRQYLLARKYHQEKMQQVHELKVGADGKTIWTGEKASTYHPKERLQEQDPGMTDLQQFQQPSRIFQTEYADSSIGRDGNSDILRTPLLPKREDGTRVKYGEHFECPYCRRMQMFDQKSAWKKHVFSDLRPYVCTFEPCGLNMFESQHQWFDHELQFHRPQYACLQCPSPPHLTRPGLQSHYKEKHSNLSVSIDDILEKSKLGRINASSCPLCQEYGAKYMKINQSTKCDVSLKQFQKHLGDHMEQLALAALPPDDTEDEEQETDEELGHADKESLGLSDKEKGDEDIDVKLELKKLERKDYYQILGIEPDADVSHIREAFGRLSLKYQVERNMESGLGDKETDKRLNEIREAYAILGDSSLRASYDEENGVSVEASGEKELEKKMNEGSSLDAEILASAVSNPHYKHPSDKEEFGIRDSCPIYGLPLDRLEVYLTRRFSDFWMMLPTDNDDLYCFEIPRPLSSVCGLFFTSFATNS